jgi:diguanylate cyclase (GGDEF)-like protein
MSFEAALTDALAAPGRGAVAMVDLDRFKEINDLFGHETGDRLLVEIARRLRDSIGDTDVVARFGGDEFAMLLADSGSDSPDGLVRRMRVIHERLTHQVEIDGVEFDIGASVGVARWPLDGTTSEDLVRRADAAMYQAKRSQIGVAFYWPALDADAPRRMELSLSCRAALERDEFTIHLQPKIDIRDGRIAGAEALARWTHPRYGAIPPTEFVPLLAQAGLSGALTRTVAVQAAQAACTLRDAGLEIPIAINLAPRDLLDGSLPEALLDILTQAGLQPTALEIEVTEDATIDFEASLSMLDRLRSIGMRVSIDDFGTGYSSLQRLHRLAIDQLKIDRSFIARLAFDPSALSIVSAAINLARDFGLTTVVEGVEDRETLELVGQLGCDQAQGYVISRPVPTVDFLRWAAGWRSQRSELVACSVAGSAAST